MTKHVLSAILILVAKAGFTQHNIEVSKTGKYKTIQSAANIAQTGDTITVHAGVYRERIDPPTSGVTYRAAKKEKVEIRGSEQIRNWRKQNATTWTVSLPNTFFGNFNPYSDVIKGDWYDDIGQTQHTGAVYLNGHWFMEAKSRESIDEKTWFATVDKDSTHIWANFGKTNPNTATTEINVRQTIFYPSKTGINDITVSGFTMKHAATPWAPPTAEQIGLIGTNWSRGWTIENCDISYSKCSGIALGKYGDEYDNKSANSAEGYVETVKRALNNGWNSATVGHHTVRNNTITFCEQTGIVGSLGCAFSTITGNTIHDIHMQRLFSGAEMCAIKFHGAVDMLIANNHIYHNYRAIWLDWMAQGTRLTNNLLYDNDDCDIYFEVDHGPIMVDNNTMLSPLSQKVWSQGIAYIHNLIAGQFELVADNRLTPVLKPHSTELLDLHNNPSGDIRFYNNIFTGRDANLHLFDKTDLPVTAAGNIFDTASTQSPKLFNHNGHAYLQFNFPQLPNDYRSFSVTTESLGNTAITHQSFEQPNGQPYQFNQTYPGPYQPSAAPIQLNIPGPVLAYQPLNRTVPRNWHLLDHDKDNFYGISLEQANARMAKKGLPQKKVVVAIIDAGIDTTHEALRNRLWTNTKEIPGNNIDDDHNGYTDDIHGWNYLGGTDGSNVSKDAGEIARVYFQYKDRFATDTTNLSAADQYLYKQWKKAAQIRRLNQQHIPDPAPYENALNNLRHSDSIVRLHTNSNAYTLADLDTIQSATQPGIDARNYLRGLMKANQLPDTTTITSFLTVFANYTGELRQKQNDLQSPPTPYRNSITKDNEEDLHDTNYGNPNVQAASYYHGTHVAGIVTAIAPSAQIMMLRVVPDGDEHDKDIALAIRYAVDNGARIINMSFGKELSPHKDWIDDAVQYAGKKGVLLIHAAGNDHKNIDTAWNFPNATFLNGKQAPNWIEVAASGNADRDLGGKLPAAFSNYGKHTVDVFAPGVQIWSTAPGNKYEPQNGTSMATPVVAGIAAYLLSYYPNLTATQLKKIIGQSAIRPTTTDLHPYSRTGAIVNLYKALLLCRN